MILSHSDQVLKVNRWINHFGRIHTSASQSKKAVCAFQTAFFYLERFLKILADDQSYFHTTFYHTGETFDLKLDVKWKYLPCLIFLHRPTAFLLLFCTVYLNNTMGKGRLIT